PLFCGRLCASLSFYRHGHHLVLHSFPTRRSSDLSPAGKGPAKARFSTCCRVSDGSATRSVMVRRDVAAPSVTLTRNTYAPVSVGAPLNRPALESARPGGGAAESRTQAYAPAPQAAVRPRGEG